MQKWMGENGGRNERWWETTLRRVAKTTMVKVRTTTTTLEKMNIARAGQDRRGVSRLRDGGVKKDKVQTEEGIDAVPHEVVGGEEEVTNCGQEGDDGQDVHDAEVADGRWTVIGLARAHQRGRFVLGKHSVHPRRKKRWKGNERIKEASGNSDRRYKQRHHKDQRREEITGTRGRWLRKG